MSGTRVLTGEGKMLIIVVGDSSCVGKISALLRSDEEEGIFFNIKLLSYPTLNEISCYCWGYW